MWWSSNLIGAAVYFLSFSCEATESPRLLNPQVSNGTLVAIEVDPSKKWTGRALGGDLVFFKDQGRTLGLFGVPYHHELKDFEVVLEGVAGESRETFRLAVPMVPGGYPRETLKVSPKHVNPSPKDLARIEREKVEVGKVYAASSDKKLWQSPFVAPVTTEMTSRYGTQRVFNGELQSYHNGIDFRAKVGRRIRAANAGRVVLAKHLFYTGNTVILDHGLGVMTLYAHMSKLNVKAGQKVERRAPLGLAGQTGRANGPHLHFSTVVRRVRVNPVDLFAYLGDRASGGPLFKSATPSTLEETHAPQSPAPASPSAPPSPEPSGEGILVPDPATAPDS